MAAEAYARKSQGRIFPRDVLHGTFLRFDRTQEGRLDYNGTYSPYRPPLLNCMYYVHFSSLDSSSFPNIAL